MPSTTTELRASSQDKEAAAPVPAATVSTPAVVEAIVKVEPEIKVRLANTYILMY